jgi:hypothetical protein
LARLHATNRGQNRIGLVNGNGVWIHHVESRAGFCPAAFIFSERRAAWLIAGISRAARPLRHGFDREPVVKSQRARTAMG